VRAKRSTLEADGATVHSDQEGSTADDVLIIDGSEEWRITSEIPQSSSPR
jgi:hypothetical protein